VLFSRPYIETVRKNHDQVIDNVNLDTVLFCGWDEQRVERADVNISTFRRFIDENKDELTALQVIYGQSYKTRPLTLKIIKELYEKLSAPPFNLTLECLWESYYIKRQTAVKARGTLRMLTDIVSLIRFELGQMEELVPFADHVNARFKQWTFEKNAGNLHFTEEQMGWLRMVKDHIATSINIEKEDLELSPFDNQGGLGRFYQIFGNSYLDLLQEMNEALVA